MKYFWSTAYAVIQWFAYSPMVMGGSNVDSDSPINISLPKGKKNPYQGLTLFPNIFRRRQESRKHIEEIISLEAK